MMELTYWTREQLLELFLTQRQWADNVIKDGTDNLPPCLYIACVDPLDTDAPWKGVLFLIETDFNTGLEKKKAIKKAAAMIYKKLRLMPVAVAMASECWMARHKEGTVALMPSDNPDRVEAINVAALAFHKPDEEGPVLFDVREVRRDPDNKMQWDGEWQEPWKDEKFSIQANILENFFMAYIRFALGHDDPLAYLNDEAEDIREVFRRPESVS